MKKSSLLIFAIILFSNSFIYSQKSKCVSGDCNSGFGKSVFTSPNHGTYEGNWRDGTWHGQGKLEIKDEFIYIGEFNNNIMEGKGEMMLSNGNSYIGEFSNNFFHGNGTYFYSNGDKYKGQFLQGTIEGYGVLKYSNGNQYSGDFINSMFHGYGEVKYQNGTFYGLFEKGKKQGKGKFYDLTGELIEEGEWQEDSLKYPDNFLKFEKAFKQCFSGTFEIEGHLIKVKSCFQLNRDYSVSGSSLMTISENGHEYEYGVNVTSQLDPNTFQFSYRHGSRFISDTVPGGFHWFTFSSTTTATLFSDPEHPGHYIIEAKNSDGVKYVLNTYESNSSN